VGNPGDSITVSEFLAIKWGEIEGPLIEPPRFSPIIADPSFLFPEETPNGAWELFAHSAWGIHRYSSLDSLAWIDRGLVIRNAMRPFVRKIAERSGKLTFADGDDYSLNGNRDHDGGQFFLFYEAYPPIALALTALPGRRKWRSRIELSKSIDLASWSRPTTVAEPLLPWMKDSILGDSVSNPCLVCATEAAAAGEWRLYHSAGLSWIEDCGFCEPRYIACATGQMPSGPFTPLPTPIIDPAQDPMPGVLGAGSIKAIRLSDGWIGLQNKIFGDREGRSRSAIFLLFSEDGLAWRLAREEPILAPANGWTSTHVYACDCRFRAEDGLWYLYFNARDGWKLKSGIERIGRIVGKPEKS